MDAFLLGVMCTLTVTTLILSERRILDLVSAVLPHTHPTSPSHTLINGFCCESETECDFEEDLVNITGCCRNGGPINITQWRTDEDAYLTCGFPPRMRKRNDAFSKDEVMCHDGKPLYPISRYVSAQEAYLKCGFPSHMKVPRFDIYPPGCLESGEGPKDIHLWSSDEEAYKACGFPRYMHKRRMPTGEGGCETTLSREARRVPNGPRDLYGWSSDADAYIICGFPPHMRKQRDVPKRVFCESC